MRSLQVTTVEQEGQEDMLSFGYLSASLLIKKDQDFGQMWYKDSVKKGLRFTHWTAERSGKAESEAICEEVIFSIDEFPVTSVILPILFF